jgi:hypothetical protein
VPYDNALRLHWKAAGYRTDMGSAAIGLPPPKPFVRLYHLTNATHALTNIRKGRLKVTRISEANDPFELMALNFRDGRIRTAVAEYRTALDSERGLLCFSEDWTSPLLWSNYAHSHQGICLGFNVLENFVEKVTYQDKRIRAAIDDETGDPFGLSQIQQSALCHTKCHEWAYEKERRRFLLLKEAFCECGIYFWHFGEDMQLAEVILGPHCYTELIPLRGEVAALYPGARTFSARLAWQHFKVVPKEKTLPDAI